MSAVQRRLYAHMQRSGVILTDGIDKGSSGSATGAKALNNTVMQLRKICNHPFLFEAFESSFARHLQLPGGIVNNVDLWRASGKFELLDRVLFKLLSRRHRCLIFSQFVSLLTVCIFHPQFSVVHIYLDPWRFFDFPRHQILGSRWFAIFTDFIASLTTNQAQRSRKIALNTWKNSTHLTLNMTSSYLGMCDIILAIKKVVYSFSQYSCWRTWLELADRRHGHYFWQWLESASRRTSQCFLSDITWAR